MKPPGALVQVVSGSQPPLLVAHSLMSVQPVAPVPLYPEGQGPHMKLPGVLVQVVSASQPPLLAAHSSTSVQPLAPPPV